MPPPWFSIYVYFHNIQTSSRPIKAKFYVKHYEGWGKKKIYIYIYINHDPVVTLTYFATRST